MAVGRARPVSELQILPVPSGVGVVGILPQLSEMLDGTAPAALPVPAADERETRRLTEIGRAHV